MRQKLLILAALSLCSALFCACAPALGDSCHTDTECSATGDRFCDRSAPGGYCTIVNCEPKSCGNEGVCVRFKPQQPRLSSDWCMAKCSTTGDCDRSAYVCRSAMQLGFTEDDSGVEPTDGGPATTTVLTVAEVLDSDTNQKFCVVRE